MAFPSYPLMLAASVTDGAALNTSTTRTAILHASGKPTIPAGALQVGSNILLKARGRISTFTSGTLTLDMALATTAITSLGAITMVASQTNLTFDLEIWATVRALGASGVATVMSTGAIKSFAVASSADAILPASAPATVSTLDTSVANLVDLYATWSVSNAANSIQVHQSMIQLWG